MTTIVTSSQIFLRPAVTGPTMRRKIADEAACHRQYAELNMVNPAMAND